MSFFLTKPHIANTDGSIITPDILIDRLYRHEAGETTPVPLGLVSHDFWVQVPSGGIATTPAVLLLAAGAGTILFPAVVLGDGRICLARKAWRLRQLDGDGAELSLDGTSLGDFADPAQVIATIPGSDGTSLARGLAAVCPLAAATRQSAAGSRVTIGLSDGDRTLNYSIDLKDVTADHWPERPQPQYSEGPQFREVTHYV